MLVWFKCLINLIYISNYKLNKNQNKFKLFNYLNYLFNMNNSFRGAFNYGFNRSFFNSKYTFNLFNCSSNKAKAFKINISNKFFITKTLSLTQSQTILNQINNTNSFCGLMSTFNESISELALTGMESVDSIGLIGEICFLRDDCKWTCGTRLTSGPRSPMEGL